MLKKYTLIFLALIIAVPLAFGSVAPAPVKSADNGNSKISGLLELQVQTKLNSGAGAMEHGAMFPMTQGAPAGLSEPDNQKLFIYFEERPDESQLAELEDDGITVYPDSWIPPLKNHPCGFMYAEMPPDRLEQVAGSGFVTRLDTAERYLEPHNDVATQVMNVDDVRGGDPGYDGTGVTIAVLDSGLDVTRADIPTPVASKDYSEYPDLDDTIANIPGVTGHGTHVTGSAVGDASNTPGSTYSGSAPGADLVFLKIGNDTNGNASSDAIVYAIRDAVDFYGADVITMSYGGWDQFHDGTSQEAQAVDYAVSQGAVVFISAGNDADDRHHYSGTVGPNGYSDWIGVNVTSLGNFFYNMVWYDGVARNDLQLEYYQSNKSTQLTPVNASVQSESLRGTEDEYSWVGTSTSALSNISPGIYYLRVKNNSSATQFFHLYNVTSSGNVYFLNPDEEYTLGSPANADSAIAVGSYNTRQDWFTVNNDHYYYSSLPEEEISVFSSRGPRVDTGAMDKVSIVAPGAAIISARDNDVYPWVSGGSYSYSNLVIDNDGPNRGNADGGSNDNTGPADYIIMTGTSMACPLAAGVGALILEAHPDWTPAQVKHALEANAVDEGDAGRDDDYGWGLVDALGAVDATLPVAASYSDAGHLEPCDDFNQAVTESTVYLEFSDLLPEHPYRVVYFNGDDSIRTSEVFTSGASGNISSHHEFNEGSDLPGTWHVIVCESAFTPVGSYNGTWAYTVAGAGFNVDESAIPEFPTFIAAVAAFALCAGIYLRMRRKSAGARLETLRPASF